MLLLLLSETLDELVETLVGHLAEQVSHAPCEIHVERMHLRSDRSHFLLTCLC